MFGQSLFQQFCNKHVQLVQTSNVSPLITPSFTAHLCLYPNSHAATNALPQSHDQVDVALSPSASLRRHLRGRGEPPTRATSPFSTTNATIMAQSPSKRANPLFWCLFRTSQKQQTNGHRLSLCTTGPPGTMGTTISWTISVFSMPFGGRHMEQAELWWLEAVRRSFVI